MINNDKIANIFNILNAEAAKRKEEESKRFLEYCMKQADRAKRERKK